MSADRVVCIQLLGMLPCEDFYYESFFEPRKRLIRMILATFKA